MIGRFIFVPFLILELIIDLDAQVQQTANEFLRPELTESIYPVIWNDSSVYISDTVQNNYTFNFDCWFKNQHLYSIKRANLWITLDPAIFFAVGYDKRDHRSTYENTRGFRISGMLYNRLLFSSELYETQARGFHSLQVFVDSFSVVPQHNRAKPFRNHAYDVASVFGCFSYRVNKHTHISIFRDIVHIGYGYRSLFLSNQAAPRTFLRIHTNQKFFAYDYLFDILQNVSLNGIINAPQSALGGFQNKYASHIFLRFFTPFGVELGIFESVIWAPFTTAYNALHLKFFNPFPLSRTFYYGLNDKNNALLGCQLKVEPFPKLFIYSQYAVDQCDVQMQRAAIQIGAKLKISESISFQTEYNRIGAYMYAHYDVLQSYSHYNQPLAHPLGANLNELLGRFRITKGNVTFLMMMSYVSGGKDNDYEQNGQNVYANPDVSGWKGGMLGHLTKTSDRLMFIDSRFYYTINPVAPYNLFCEWILQWNNLHTFPFTYHVQIGISSKFRSNEKLLSWL